MVRREQSNARGEETRRRLLEAGLELFGRHGFEKVTTRDLAARAGVNLAAIPYHFGTKDAVYLAVAEDIVAHMRQRMDPGFEMMRRLLKDAQASPEQLVEAICQVLERLCLEILGDAQNAVRAMFIFREQANPTQAFDLIYGGFMREFHETLATVLGRVLERPADDELVILRTHALLGQVMAFRAAESAALRRLGWDGYGSEESRRVAAAIVAQTRAALQAQAQS